MLFALGVLVEAGYHIVGRQCLWVHEALGGGDAHPAQVEAVGVLISTMARTILYVSTCRGPLSM